MKLPRYEEYKDSGVEWLGNVPAHWNTRRLGFFFEERREKVSDKEFAPLSVTKIGIVPQLQTAAKTDDGDNRKKVVAGDFVINSRSDRKGSAGTAYQDGSVSLINTVLRPIEGISNQFAHYLLRSTPFQEEFYRFGKGIVADLWSTNYSEMRNIVLATPDVGEQTAIAAFLDHETAKIDALIVEQEKLIALLAEKRQATISHAVTRGLNPDAPMKDSGVEWLGEVPAYWDVRKINSLSNKITNGYVGPTRDILVDVGVRYLQSLHIKGNRIKFDAPYFVAEKWSNEHKKSILQTGDLLIVQTGDIGQAAVVTDEFAGCNCHALIIVSPVGDVVLGEYLGWVFNSSYGKNTLLAIQTGALHPHLNCGNVKEVAVPLPPILEQSRIVEHCVLATSSFDELMSLAEEAIGLLKERRSALIAAAVTGQIDVRGFVKETAE